MTGWNTIVANGSNYQDNNNKESRYKKQRHQSGTPSLWDVILSISKEKISAMNDHSKNVEKMKKRD